MRRPTPAIIFTTTLFAMLLMVWWTLSVSAISAKNLPPMAARPTLAVPTQVQPAQADSNPPAVPAVAQNAAPADLSASQSAEPVTGNQVSSPSLNSGSVPSIAPVFIEPTKPAYINSLKQFAAAVKDGQPDHLVGVMVPGLFALDVVQQPLSDPNWVSDLENQMTEFRSAANNGVTGLLAHNTHAGRDFDKLKLGDVVSLVYGDGGVKRFKITSAGRFQSLEPQNPTGDLVDLSTNQRLTAGDVFNQYYTGNYPVVLQTCIEKDGDSEWGRLFLTAVPVSS